MDKQKLMADFLNKARDAASIMEALYKRLERVKMSDPAERERVCRDIGFWTGVARTYYDAVEALELLEDNK